MRNPFTYLFPNQQASLSDKTQHLFERLFPNAINVEWTIGKKTEEAIFYLDSKEVIASFEKGKGLLEYRINHDIHQLPPMIEQAVGAYGEIMNAISVHKSHDHDRPDHYEIIFRDKDLVRFTLLLDVVGKTLNVSQL